ncbi:MAG: hypothetical protein ACE5I2_11480, partial [Anaerolineae bacterium]
RQAARCRGSRWTGPAGRDAETVVAVEKAGLRDYAKLAHFCGHGIGNEVLSQLQSRRAIKRV